MLITQPYDGALIAEITPHTPAEIEAMLDRATRVFADRAAWLPPYRRIEIIKRLAALVDRDRETFALRIALEGGKPITDAQVEVARAINSIEWAASHIEHLVGAEIPMGLTPASANRWAFTTREPVGPVVAISAFNHPLNLIVHQVLPAIATGCPVLVKPSAMTPLTCLHFIQLVREAGLSEPWCQAVLIDENAHSESLATDPRVAFLSFIGSARVGWHLRSQLAPGARFALEHGGAAPVIVDRSANLDIILEPLTKGACYHAGQVCVSVQRIFVHHDLKTEFVERLAERIRQLRVGDPTLPKTEVGPLIAPKEVTRIEHWVAKAVQEGATIAVGGTRIGTRHFQPTLLVEPHANSLVSTSEIFGPVACVYGFRELSNAITRANSLPFAFQASVFSTDIDAALAAARLLDASAVMINDHTAFRTDWMPFAGRRQSGFGIGGIPYTMHDMMQDKLVVLKLPAMEDD
ncbi:aldehyde dehydrogenase family protein [Tunturibacter empetritectus]|uniref:Acyl-CoA reductase-like NAD-dependent aldehyde dehydrogenase n=1 Tax=Tunturiibacter lichenicola TaxID=2051959 RepID=A0A7W8J6U6_9BACT|nr:aldehyde dehydrogenase family protein [Edaphobacter lichenicola]MBB5343747.1 acyl-CoA reductase-like NAD-dependent aldehyde dehydrogenase [Edaphobacter lichenicola]